MGEENQDLFHWGPWSLVTNFVLCTKYQLFYKKKQEGSFSKMKSIQVDLTG